MTPERWQRVKALFERVLDQPTAARVAGPDASDESPSVVKEVRRLLADDEEAGRFLGSGDATGTLNAALGRWRRVEALYRSALERAPENRAAFLAEACSDLELRQEVEGLLAQPGDGILDHSTAEAVTSGRLGPYEIRRVIGVGGMGQVFEGRDSRLGRSVAIKTCAAEFASRFAREAQAISALNHPNICTLYDVGPNYLVMELVEGPTLAERIKRGALGFEEVVKIARQIADALEAAHERGIIHRDLKPANIKIRPDGTVKVLDFGLAKSMVEQTVLAASSDDSPIVTVSDTVRDMILGTPGYMSPEQARGQTVDQRADIWAFGVLLWEMVTGRRLFRRETVSDTLSAVLKSEPDWENAPPEWRRLLRACLAKDPRQRLRNVADALRLVDDDESRLDSKTGTARTPRRRALRMLATTLTLLAAGGIGTWMIRGALRPAVSPLASVQYKIPAPPSALRPDATFHVALSQDGRKLAFIAKVSGTNYLWVQPLNSLTAQRLDHTEGAQHPFWSPDGQAVAYFADGALKRIAISGGTPQVIAQPVAPGDGQWSRFGVIVFAIGGDLWQVPADGGVVSPAILPLPTTPASGLRRGLKGFLPDGKRIVYFEGTSASLAHTYVQALGASGRVEISGKPVGYTSGYLLMWGGNSVMAQRFDPARLKAEGEPVYVASLDLPFVDVSENGVMALQSHPPAPRQLQLTWFDRAGKRVGTVPQSGGGSPALSPDGKRLLFHAGGIHLYDLARGSDSVLASDGMCPTWSPDGGRFAFNSPPSAGHKIFVKNAFGTGLEEILLAIPNEIDFPMDWSPDGRWLAYSRFAFGDPLSMFGDPLSIWMLSLPDRTRQLYVENGDRPRFSPDGKWVAYDSPVSGRSEVYVQPFPATGRTWTISITGGHEPQWRGDGRELFYTSDETPRRMMAVEIAEERGELRPSVPRALFGVPWWQDTVTRNNWVVTRDGRRFLGRVPMDAREGQPDFVCTIIYNWPAVLAERH